MAKYLIDVDCDLVDFFVSNIDDTERVEILLAKMLKLLREILRETMNN
jgi:hypothetical protein